MNDRILYDFLPETVFDAHVHLFGVPVKSLGAKDFRRKFHGHFGAEDYSAFAESLFPGKDFKMAGFGMIHTVFFEFKIRSDENGTADALQ